MIEFGDDLIVFLGKIEEMDPAVASILSSVMGSILAAVGAGALTALCEALNLDTPLDVLGEDLEDFGEAIGGFCSSMDTYKISKSHVEKAKMIGQIAKALIEGTNLGFLDSIIAAFDGETDLEAFKEGIDGFGEAIGSFCDSIVGYDSINESAVTKTGYIKDIASALIEGTNLGWFDSLIAGFDGTTDLEAFKYGIKGFGEAIGSYCDSIASYDNINDDAIEKTKKIGEIAKALIESTNLGWWDTSASNNYYMSSWGVEYDTDNTTDLVKFAEGLEELLDVLTDAVEDLNRFTVDPDILDNIADFATEMGELVDITDISWADWGETDFEKFIGGFESMLDAIATFGRNIEGGEILGLHLTPIDTEALASVVDSALDLSALAHNVTEFDDGDSLSDFGENIIHLSDGLIDFSSSLTEINTDEYNLDDAIANAQKFIDFVEKDCTGVDFSGLEELSTTMKNFATNGIEAFVKEFNGVKLQTRVENIGTQLVAWLKKGISAVKGEFKTTASSVIAAPSPLKQR